MKHGVRHKQDNWKEDGWVKQNGQTLQLGGYTM
jgi:hypothetical protein